MSEHSHKRDLSMWEAASSAPGTPKPTGRLSSKPFTALMANWLSEQIAMIVFARPSFIPFWNTQQCLQLHVEHWRPPSQAFRCRLMPWSLACGRQPRHRYPSLSPDLLPFQKHLALQPVLFPGKLNSNSKSNFAVVKSTTEPRTEPWPLLPCGVAQFPCTAMEWRDQKQGHTGQVSKSAIAKGPKTCYIWWGKHIFVGFMKDLKL